MKKYNRKNRLILSKTALLILVIFLFGHNTLFSRNTGKLYYPERAGVWEKKEPEEFGFNKLKISDLIKFAMNNEYSGPKDLRIAILKSFAHEPYIKIVGPTKKRGGPAGIILKKGYIIAQWGDVHRVDMTFSVTKSYLSTIAGLASDKGLISDVSDSVKNYVWDGKFAGKHNSEITWSDLLNQSSDWKGTLFGKKDWADRPPQTGGPDSWERRDLHKPGTFFKYNDVRVNLLSYCLLQVWRKPLPVVLKERIMDPIGASTTWRWYGYSTSWVNIDGLKVQSVSGGGHSGGGLFISTLDHARYGLLFMRDGKWNGKQLISKNWIDMAVKSSPANKSYGFMWWLNRGDRRIEGVPSNVFFAAGFGGNYIIIDRVNRVVLVLRWLEPSKLKKFLKLFYDSF